VWGLGAGGTAPHGRGEERYIWNSGKEAMKAFDSGTHGENKEKSSRFGIGAGKARNLGDVGRGDTLSSSRGVSSSKAWSSLTRGPKRVRYTSFLSRMGDLSRAGETCAQHL